MSTIAPFEFTISVNASDIDRLNHVNNVAFVRMVQDAALKHWFHIAPAHAHDEIIWVCRRHEIDYLKPAFLDQILHIKTWVGDPIGATWERLTEISRADDGTVLLKARTVWVLLDAKSGRPRRVDTVIKSWFEGRAVN
ncbi:MAG: thioesterase family protein [Gemmataceae bacterium]